MKFLAKDFDNRCGYSLLLFSEANNAVEVDHHDAQLKPPFRHRYENLVPALAHCNRAKSDHPSTEARAAGLRFLNPKVECDYNEVIFESPDTHELVGTTAIANYHIKMLGLNHPFLVRKRQQRADARAFLASNVQYRGTWEEAETVAKSIRVLQDMADVIPAIESPPHE